MGDRTHVEEMLCSHGRSGKGRLGLSQRSRLDSMLARSYTDDFELQRGALSVPRTSSRPGSRDDNDVPQRLFAGIRAVL